MWWILAVLCLCAQRNYSISSVVNINKQPDFFQGYGIGNKTIEIKSSVCLPITFSDARLGGNFFIAPHAVAPMNLGIDYISTMDGVVELPNKWTNIGSCQLETLDASS